MSGSDVREILSALVIAGIIFNFGMYQYKITRQIKVLKRVVIKIADKLKIDLFDVNIK